MSLDKPPLWDLCDVRAHPYAEAAIYGLGHEDRENALRLAMWFVDCPSAAVGSLAEPSFARVVGPAASLAQRLKDNPVRMAPR